jgi:beta-lactamase superfamily II metal-dependent hydrolase
MIDPSVALYCLEVGHGACAAILEPRPGLPNECQATLIDVGKNGKRLAGWLRRFRVTRIPAILLTHNHSDHIEGLDHLVPAFKQRINKVYFVVDGPKAPPILLLLEQWEEDRWVNQVRILTAPRYPQQVLGDLVVGPDDGCSFRLYCAYPPVTLSLGLLGWLKSRLQALFGNRNAVSAVLGLTPRDAAAPSHALFGGDLTYRGWQHLVGTGRDLRCEVLLAPHHGGPQQARKDFGASELADATRPAFALVSVGTSSPDTLPHDDLIRALRATGATVLCTQITHKCLPPARPPASVPHLAILPRLANMPCISSGGTACAGSIQVTFPATGPHVDRLVPHQAAVDQLQAPGHLPLCRR